MILHVENEISDYWNMSRATPDHPISKHMLRDRFQELHIRFRCEQPGIKGPYARVNCTTNYNNSWLILVGIG
jgi:hypothetical protein